MWVTNWLLHSRAGGRGPDAQEGRRDIAGTRASLLCGLAITSAHLIDLRHLRHSGPCNGENMRPRHTNR